MRFGIPPCTPAPLQSVALLAEIIFDQGYVPGGGGGGGGGGGVMTLFTVTEMEDEVVVLLEVSLAVAVRVWDALDVVVVSQDIE